MNIAASLADATVTTFRIATRSSPLALWQANHVAGLLKERAGVGAELVHVSTLGDRDRSDSIASFGGIGIFTREVQRAVLDGRADLAVHSLKDLPTDPAEGLTLAAVPSRAPRFDALVLPAGASVSDDSAVALAALPDRARVGTGSPRRRAQLLRFRPDLHLEDVRGNVGTRLRKLDEGEFDALVLAEAGLVRLGLGGRVSLTLSPPMFLPAVGQGALGIECRAGDVAAVEAIQRLDDPVARTETTAERAALAALRAGCHAPVGAFAVVEGGRLRLEVVVLSGDGRSRVAESAEGEVGDAAGIGGVAAERILGSGGAKLLAWPV